MTLIYTSEEKAKDSVSLQHLDEILEERDKRNESLISKLFGLYYSGPDTLIDALAKVAVIVACISIVRTFGMN